MQSQSYISLVLYIFMTIQKILLEVDHYLLKIANLSDPRLKQLSEQPTFAARMRFADINFKRLIAGSGRVAYQYAPDLILKLAKNDKGIAQNATEADGFLQQHYKELVANVIDSDPDDKWIVSEMATKISESEFKNLTGISFKNLCNYLDVRFSNGKNMYLPKVENEEELDNNNFVSDLVDMMANFNMPTGDIKRIRSWGKIKNRAILMDYGLTQQIFDDMYKR